ncbi:hypothetical protein BZA77DRAFT_363396 [Pyronema omphalodes]|nr:hypothetical protein BZA77DRAFT_363396 [Pyronema omphalodes]
MGGKSKKPFHPKVKMIATAGRSSAKADAARTNAFFNQTENQPPAQQPASEDIRKEITNQLARVASTAAMSAMSDTANDLAATTAFVNPNGEKGFMVSNIYKEGIKKAKEKVDAVIAETAAKCAAKEADSVNELLNPVDKLLLTRNSSKSSTVTGKEAMEMRNSSREVESNNGQLKGENGTNTEKCHSSANDANEENTDKTWTNAYQFPPEATQSFVEPESMRLIRKKTVVDFFDELNRGVRNIKETVACVKERIKREKEQRLLEELNRKEKELRAKDAMELCRLHHGESSKQKQAILDDEWEVEFDCSCEKVKSSQGDREANAIPGIDYESDTWATSSNESGKRIQCNRDNYKALEDTRPSNDEKRYSSISNGDIVSSSHFEVKKELEEKTKRLEEYDKELAMFEGQQQMMTDVYKKKIERIQQERAKIQQLISHNQLFIAILSAQIGCLEPDNEAS